MKKKLRFIAVSKATRKKTISSSWPPIMMKLSLQDVLMWQMVGCGDAGVNFMVRYVFSYGIACRYVFEETPSPPN